MGLSEDEGAVLVSDGFLLALGLLAAGGTPTQRLALAIGGSPLRGHCGGYAGRWMTCTRGGSTLEFDEKEARGTQAYKFIVPQLRSANRVNYEVMVSSILVSSDSCRTRA